ncbi:hypothetical protein [Henriciella sp.]|uniref:hypothetical protein n=1 Tax=Henriciella sp. TaxID=1968823 RepID=UPI000C10E47D|nr:hypothetical protein [Henriciella sp.]PHR83105.1 MAG: hypothetical protein COA64_00170 [Henriciella sp.]
MYGTVEDWRTYATERGDSAPSEATDAAASAALVRASDYIEFHYVRHFVLPCTADMPLVARAAYIAASLELATPGFFSANIVPNEAIAEVGAGSARVKFRDGVDPIAGAVPVVSAIDSMFEDCVAKSRRFGLRTIG